MKKQFLTLTSFLVSLCYCLLSNLVSVTTALAVVNRRHAFLSSLPILSSFYIPPNNDSFAAYAASSEAQKLFNQARALESQGNMAAAQRIYGKVTEMDPDFVYGWSNLGNAQIALGDTVGAEVSYTKAVDLCAAETTETTTTSSSLLCPDRYIVYLNRGALRINANAPQAGLADLQRAAQLRGRPDAIVLQNLARAEELNGLYMQADRDYTVAIQMTAREVAPFWLRSALVKYQLGDIKGGWDLLQRVNQRFPDAPEVRAAYAVFLWTREDADGARQKFLTIPDRARLKYSDREYLAQKISWPPLMIQGVGEITKAVGDSV